MVFARNAAMGFNRLADHKTDAKNRRTLQREIPSGKISYSGAVIFVIMNGIGFIVTTWFINLLCFWLSFVALSVILGYSLTKRFTWLCHLILGLGLSLAPIGAYLAVTGSFHPAPVILSLAVLFWVAGFDIIYALQDTEFDQKQGLYSIPSIFGKKKALLLAGAIHAAVILLVFYLGMFAGFNLVYFIGCAVFSIFIVYQHILVKPNNLSKINVAFFTTNGIASVLFAVFTILSFYS